MNLKEAQELLEGANRSLARIHAHMTGRNVGIITAHRSENTAQENEKRNSELQGAIRSHGFGYVHIRGKYIENKDTPQQKHVSEHSFMVIGKKGDDGGQMKGFLKKMGAHYGQEAVVHKPHDSSDAHYTITKNHGDSKVGDSFSVGEFHPNKVGDYHSSLRKGPPRGKGAYSVMDHTQKEHKKFDSHPEAKAYLADKMKSGELKHGSKIHFNGRSFMNSNEVEPNKRREPKTYRQMSSQWNEGFEEFDFWTPKSFFAREEYPFDPE